MKVFQGVLRSLDVGLSRQFHLPLGLRKFSLSSSQGSDNNQNTQSFESADAFEQRIFGDIGGSSDNLNPFYQHMNGVDKDKDRSSSSSKFNFRNRSEFMDSLDESFSSLSDGMDGKLKKAATYFEFHADEILKEDYAFRPDMSFRSGTTYSPKDLDLKRPPVRKPVKWIGFQVTTEEVLKTADFRKVRFLANFITDAGIIHKRSKTGISAKAQRKVAREIKTARAFGLLPFTTMGTKHFVYGNTMENLDADFEYETYERSKFTETEANPDLL